MDESDFTRFEFKVGFIWYPILKQPVEPGHSWPEDDLEPNGIGISLDMAMAWNKVQWQW